MRFVENKGETRRRRYDSITTNLQPTSRRSMIGRSTITGPSVPIGTLSYLERSRNVIKNLEISSNALQ